MYPTLPEDILKILENQKRLEEKLNLLSDIILSRADRQMLRHAENLLTPLEVIWTEHPSEDEEAPVVGPKIRDIFREDYLKLAE